MGKTLYLINPRSDFPTYFSAEVYAAQGFQRATLTADLALPTVAALAPADFAVTLCDENISDVDFDTCAEFIGITGKSNQHNRMVAIANEFRRRGKVVLCGGPHVSLSPQRIRNSCDILVCGECEDIAAELFSDLRASKWKDQYSGGKCDLARSPLPLWGAYRNDRALVGVVQTSRGCPFECEFCDVIQYLGRRQRHKAPSQVLAELEILYSVGYRSVFVADDNFTVHRSRTKELLRALVSWNRGCDREPVTFQTQVSIDCSRDSEMLQLCAEAGFRQLYIGLETPNTASLKEAKKRQNINVNTVEQVRMLLDYGLGVSAGMIVGFDSDATNIFEQQYHFAMSLPIPIFSVGALQAPYGTPLYDRLALNGRLVRGESGVASPWDTNIRPLQMTSSQLLSGLRWLCNRLYQPEAFGERLLQCIELLGGGRHEVGGGRRGRKVRCIESDNLRLISRVSGLGEAEEKMFARVTRAVGSKPQAAPLAFSALGTYMQVRHLYSWSGMWDPKLGRENEPRWADLEEDGPSSVTGGAAASQTVEKSGSLFPIVP